MQWQYNREGVTITRETYRDIKDDIGSHLTSSCTIFNNTNNNYNNNNNNNNSIQMYNTVEPVLSSHPLLSGQLPNSRKLCPFIIKVVLTSIKRLTLY